MLTGNTDDSYSLPNGNLLQFYIVSTYKEMRICFPRVLSECRNIFCSSQQQKPQQAACSHVAAYAT